MACRNCNECNRTMDCSGDGICEICESNPQAKETTRKEPHQSIPSTPYGFLVPTVDHQIYTILRRLHNSSGRDTECRWQYNEPQQIYSCDHVSIPSREVADLYWNQFGGNTA